MPSGMFDPSMLKGLLGGSEDGVIGRLGAVLGQGFGLFGKIHRVQDGRVFLASEIAAQPEQERASIGGRCSVPELFARHGRKIDWWQFRRWLCFRLRERADQYCEAQSGA